MSTDFLKSDADTALLESPIKFIPNDGFDDTV